MANNKFADARNNRLGAKDGSDSQQVSSRFSIDAIGDIATKSKAVSNEIYIKEPWQKFFPDPDQPRKEFDEEELQKLAETLKDEQYFPIVVWPKNEEGKYKIEMGERRWRAAQLIGGEFKLEAKIDLNAPNRKAIDTRLRQVVENDSRVELTVLEYGAVIKEAVDAGYTFAEIAQRLGWVRQSGPSEDLVSIHLSIFSMPEEGILLAKDKIVTDKTTLNLLRKINDISPERFKTFCAKIRSQGSVSRRDVNAEFLESKRIVSEGNVASEKAEQQNSSNLNMADSTSSAGQTVTNAEVDGDFEKTLNQGSGKSSTNNKQPGPNSEANKNNSPLSSNNNAKQEKNENSKNAENKTNASHKISVCITSTGEFGELILNEDSDGGVYEVMVKSKEEEGNATHRTVNLSELEIIGIQKLKVDWTI